MPIWSIRPYRKNPHISRLATTIYHWGIWLMAVCPFTFNDWRKIMFTNQELVKLLANNEKKKGVCKQLQSMGFVAISARA